MARNPSTMHQVVPPKSNPYMAPAAPAPVTPAVTAKPIVKAVPRAAAPSKTNIRKATPAMVSPTSVTAVFESIPTPKSSPRKRSYAAASAPVEEDSMSDVDESNLSFQEQEDLRR
jgi:hypothetical protein